MHKRAVPTPNPKGAYETGQSSGLTNTKHLTFADESPQSWGKLSCETQSTSPWKAGRAAFSGPSEACLLLAAEIPLGKPISSICWRVCLYFL